MNEEGQMPPTGSSAKLKKILSPVSHHRGKPRMRSKLLPPQGAPGHSSVFLAPRHYKWDIPQVHHQKKKQAPQKYDRNLRICNRTSA